MKTILCLDFDGVLCDSAEECLVVGYNAYYGRATRHPDEIDRELRDYFLRFRYLVAPANDFLLLFQAFEQGKLPLDRTAYEARRITQRAALAEFGPRFFACRNELKKDEHHWLALHTLFEQSREVLDAEFPPFFVVTTKDADSVRRLAAFHGYAQKVQGIYGKEVAVDKRQSFKCLFQDLGDEEGALRYLFLDDNSKHLSQVSSLPVEVYLATWGYVDPEARHRFSVVHDLTGITEVFHQRSS